MNKVQLVIGLLLWGVFLGEATAQEKDWEQPSEPVGFPFIETYQRGQFVGARQTWGITRAEDGLLYFGNSRYGIQESDGLSWRNIRMERNSAALSFAKREDGTIFVGGQNDFGFLRRDSLLRRSYTSLAYLLPDSAANIKDVNFTFVMEDEVHFISPEVWYIYSDSVLTEQKNSSPIQSAVKWDHSILTLNAENQIIRTRDENTLTIPIPDNGAKPIKLSATENRLFMLDEEFIVWELNEFNVWSKHFKLSGELSEAQVDIRDFLWSRSGYLHFATSLGLFTYDQSGKYIHTIYDSDGLCDNNLNQLYEDEALNIWVSSNFGVSVLEYGRTMREFLASAHNFPEYAFTLKNFNGSLYVGGDNGLFVWDDGTFRQVYDDRRVFTFELTPHGMLIGSDKGMRLLDKYGTFHTVFSGGRVDLILADRDNRKVVYYSHDGNALRKAVLSSERQFADSKLTDFKIGGFTLTEDIHGDLWVGTGRNGNFLFETVQQENVIRSVSNVRQFTTSEGLPSNGFNYTMSVGKDVGFITSDGFYRLTSDRDSIVIDHRFDDVFYGNDRAVWPVVQDSSGGIWLAWAAAQIGKAVYNPEKDSFDWIDGEYTRTEPYRDIDFIYPAGKNRVYFQTLTQKLAYFDSSLYQKPVPDINAHITSVTINSDSLLTEPRGKSHSILETPISFSNNKIRINYGMVAFLPEDHLFYQIKLEGLDNDWSDITNERYQDYTNLAEGEYTFWVRGHTLYPEEAEMASFSFVVLPPWYRTWWAYILYTFLGLGGIMLFVRVREKSLKERQQELEQEVMSRTEQIRTQNEQLEELDRMKIKLFANISHEFRTPLTISHGLVKKALQQLSDDGDAEIKKRDILVINRNMIRLKDMVDQIIDLTKSDQDHLKLNQKHYQAEKLASLSVESFRSLAEYHGHQFEFLDETEDAVLFVDRSKVEIMINNLISNAIKFTPDGGKIVIKAEVKNNQFVLTVSDTGPGIPAGDEEAIFERFHRIERDDEDYVEGMGVGLELSRTLARLHGGDIYVQPNVSQGASFVLVMPLAEIDDTTPVIALEDFEPEFMLPDEKKVKKSKLDVLERSSPQILLVEDNTDMRQYVEGVLSDLGHVTTAEDGKEAMAMIKDIRPDLIITDLMMPNMDGKTLVQKLAEHDRWKEIPVIVLSAKSLDTDKTDLLRIGVVDYITKPFEPEQLVLKSRNLLDYYKKRLSAIADSPEEEDESLTQQLISYIREHISDSSLTVDKMVSDFPQSRRSLYRNIQKETGMTPSELIREVRLTTARELVNQHGKSYRLEELSDAVGYKSSSSFRKAYENRFGVHPLG